MTAKDTDRSLDRMFDALRHPYRRRILALVNRLEDPMDRGLSIDDVATEGDDVEGLRIELHHAHLPKLDEMGYIDWDETDQRIHWGPAFEEIESLIDVLADHREELAVGWP
jgi:hypothetical protein